MFHKLRIQFIGTIIIVTAVVLSASFLAIYTSSAHSFRRNSEFRADRVPPRIEQLDPAIKRTIDEQRRVGAEQSLRELSKTLFIAGGVTLFVVFVISNLIADRVIGVIEKSYERQRQFIGDASHELRTPLATISTNIDAAMADSPTPSKWLLRAKSESENMSTLLNNLLLLAGLESSIYAAKTPPTTVDISQLLRESIEPFTSRIATKKLGFNTTLPPLQMTSIDSSKLRQLVTILIDNAVKYTEAGGELNITTTADDTAEIISVKNSFHALKKDELQRFFERFYQADESHHSAGSGLGLAIAKELATNLGVELSASSSSNYLTFTIVIPK